MSAVTHLQGLLHNPYGLVHPYEQEPTERFPRDPLARKPVMLGVATWPARAAEAVWATWRREGSPEENRTEGHWEQDAQGQSYWRVELPPFGYRERVTYQLHASQGRRRLPTEEFSFVAAGWSPVKEVIRSRVAPRHLVLECNAGDPDLRPGVVIRFSEPDVLHVRLIAAGLTLPEDNGGCIPFRVTEETSERIVLTTERLECRILLHPLRLEVYKIDGTPLLLEAETMAWLMGGPDRPLRARQTFSSPSDEGFFGFGERYNALNQRGNTLDMRVFDQYKNQGKRTYLPIPFSLSSRGYGLYLATNRQVTYDLAASRSDRWSFDAELGADAALEYYLIADEDPRRIITGFTDLVGKPTLPPKWTFGPWMSGNEWNSQAVVMEQVQKTVEHRIPASVLVIEAWSDEATFYIWNDARYTPKPGSDAFSYQDFSFPPNGGWPDPKGMINELHRLGIRVLLWQIPVMKKLEEPHSQHDADEAYMIEKGYCVHEANGQPYRVRPPWFHNGLVVDVTNPDAVRWWLSKRAYLLDELGVDGFKTDGGEHLWGRELRFADDRRGDELWNLYPNLYIGAYHRFVQKKRQGDGITFSRAGSAGAQAHPCHWAGDENSTWEAFRCSILAGLNAGISGLPFWGWDLAGFSGEVPSAELYLRAAATAVFCPIMQYHSDYNEHRKPCRDRTPWNIAERTGEQRVIEIYRRFAQLRLRLLPYIQAEAAHCAATGEPLMRALFLDWPEDPLAWEIADQYCFGRALLVAPVVELGITQRYLYLPAGEWEDFWDGTRLAGGQWVTRPAPLDIVPVYRSLDAYWPGLAPWSD
jgi:alpha-glucosidase (family GH31 glycosyl hydrolase)